MLDAASRESGGGGGQAHGSSSSVSSNAGKGTKISNFGVQSAPIATADGPRLKLLANN